MKKGISYSVFGYGKERQENCDVLSAYLRGLAICLRLNKLLYPDWVSIIHTDQSTYNAHKDYFDKIKCETIDVVICDDAPLCKAMLWRMKPIFTRNWNESSHGYDGWTYSHVICRDTDAPTTYREVQAVQYWIDHDKSLHAITDSVSHDRSLMGGMIGIRPSYFTEIMGVMDWDGLIRLGSRFDFINKGSDQDFLNEVVYPKFAQHGSDSITQHYFYGHPNSFLSDYHTCNCFQPSGHIEGCPNNYKINLPDELKESNSIAGHIGAAGGYSSAVNNFLRKFRSQFDDLNEAEKLHPTIFYWVVDKSLG